MAEEVVIPIVVDEREKGPQRAALLEAFPHATVTTLPVADYVVGEIVAMEFKSLADFEQDAGHELWNKLANLEPYPHRFLILMGTLEEWRESNPKLKYNRGEWEAAKARYEGAKMAILFSRQVALIEVEGPAGFVDFIKKVVKRLEREPREFLRPVETRKPARRTLDMEVEDVICAISGVGRKAAQRLLGKFKSVKALAEATPNDIITIDGFGKKASGHIPEVFNHEYGVKADE